MALSIEQYNALKEKSNGKEYELLIGIDVGVNTGITRYNPRTKDIIDVKTVKLHEAMQIVSKSFAMYGKNLKVYFEDARQRKWFGNAGREKLQGAGSVKRDSQIWEDYLASLGVDFAMIPPKANATKLNADRFKTITGYQGRTNEHGRDSAMLVFGR